MSITIACAWHQKYFNEPLIIEKGRTIMDEHGNQYPPLISHSICPPCVERFEEEQKKSQ
jgi:hypothetical protein